MSKTAYQRFVCIRDDFYEALEKVYRAAKMAMYIEHESATGVRSSTVYHEPGVKKKLERLLGLNRFLPSRAPGVAELCSEPQPG